MHYKPPVMQCNKDKVRGDHRRSILKTLILNIEGNSKLMPNSVGIGVKSPRGIHVTSAICMMHRQSLPM